MLNPASLLARALGSQLAENYRAVFGERRHDHAALLRSIAQLFIERLASSDALYHDAQHTVQVTLVGQAILRGKILVDGMLPEDWLHFTVATLAHDVGYLRGICPGDRPGHYVIDTSGNTMAAPRGASDAFLAPWHVERGKIFVRRRCAQIPGIDVERIARAIELTRFPVPQDGDHAETDTEAGLVRAADLIGQLGDPLHPRKINALYYELAETGVARQLGYESPADVAERYPRFFWNAVEPYLGCALAHLERTLEGKQWIAHLYAHVFVEEHLRARPGPERENGRQATAEA